MALNNCKGIANVKNAPLTRSFSEILLPCLWDVKFISKCSILKKSIPQFLKYAFKSKICIVILRNSWKTIKVKKSPFEKRLLVGDIWRELRAASLVWCQKSKTAVSLVAIAANNEKGTPPTLPLATTNLGC